MRAVLVLSATFILLSFVASCSKQDSNLEAYIREWEAIAVEFHQTAGRQASEPLPRTPFGTSSERLRAIGQKVVADGQEYEPLAKRARELDAPNGYEEHKAALVSLLEGLAKLQVALGIALTSGDKAKADASGLEIDQHRVRSFEGLIKSLEQFGIDASKWKQELDSLKAQSS